MEEAGIIHVPPCQTDRPRGRRNQSAEPPRVPPIVPPHQVHPQAPPPAALQDYCIAANSNGPSSNESPSAAACPVASINKKKEDKFRKRDPRSWENIQKATTNLGVQDSVQFVEKLYNQLYNENRQLVVNLQAKEKQHAQSIKELEKDRNDLTKAILAKGQLESLCRELQKQNKLIKDENVARIKEEEDKRREVANSFTERLNSLTSLISESKDKSNQVKEENQSIANKFTQLYEQYQERETHLDAMSKQLDLQKKLAVTQLKKAEIEHEAEKQTLMVEKKTLSLTVDGMEKELMVLRERNKALAAQVDLYKNQYAAFETTMNKSSNMFDTFKTEMGQMSKKVRQLETERDQLKKKYQTGVSNLVSLSEKHLTVESEKSKLETQLTSIKKLCRKLQEDRNALIRQLKSCNLEPDLKPFSQEQGDTEQKQEQDDLDVVTTSTKKLQLVNDEEVGDKDDISKTEQDPQNGESVMAVLKDVTAEAPPAAAAKQP